MIRRVCLSIAVLACPAAAQIPTPQTPSPPRPVQSPASPPTAEQEVPGDVRSAPCPAQPGLSAPVLRMCKAPKDQADNGPGLQREPARPGDGLLIPLTPHARS
jgi:hypothetical protein